jgi:cytochrome b involved in lipid metabolism
MNTIAIFNIDLVDFQHPGGLDVMLDYCGHDASMAFRSVGHSPAALRMLEPYLVGVLPESERMFKNSAQFSW